MEKLNWSFDKWRLCLTCSEQGLISLEIGHEPNTSSKENHLSVRGTNPLLERGRSQINEFLRGERRTFELPLDLSNLTQFQQSVLTALSQVPFGQTKTYGELALAINNPKAVRAVGGALGKNPLPVILPCHRVLAGNGLGGFSLGLEMKRLLLKSEGIDL